MKKIKLIPPFSVQIDSSTEPSALIGENLSYPEAIQMRFTWVREKEKEGYKIGFNTNRLSKGKLWEDCHIYDSTGREVR